MAKKKLKKAILAGLTAYAGAKMLGKGRLTAEQAAAGENANIKAALVDATDAGTKFPKKPDVLSGARGRDPTWWERWFHGGRTQKKAGGSVGAKSYSGGGKSYSGGGAINTRLNGKVKFRTY